MHEVYGTEVTRPDLVVLRTAQHTTMTFDEWNRHAQRYLISRPIQARQVIYTIISWMRNMPQAHKITSRIGEVVQKKMQLIAKCGPQKITELYGSRAYEPTEEEMCEIWEMYLEVNALVCEYLELIGDGQASKA